MIRPRLIALLPLAAVLVAGCTSFSDNDAVARYEGVELSSAELVELMDAIRQPNTPSDPTDAVAARDIISTWVRIEAVKQALDTANIDVTAAQLDDATSQMSSIVPDFAELSDRTRDYLVEAQASFLAFADVPPPTESTLRARYELGPERSGVVCVAHILVDTEDEADDIVAELAAGTAFAALAAERSIDPGSAAEGGVIPCTPTAQFAATLVPPFVDASFAAEIGVPTEPIESEFGYHVILVRPFDDAQSELESFFQPQEFAITRTIEQADVYIDPRYGTLAGTQVVALS